MQVKSLDQVNVAEKVETYPKNAADTDDVDDDDYDTCPDDSCSAYCTTEDSEDDIDSTDEEKQVTIAETDESIPKNTSDILNWKSYASYGINYYYLLCRRTIENN